MVWPFHDKQHDIQRYLVRRFSYVVIYRFKDEVVRMIAVMHLRRHPDYW
uniref:ParE toxin of type II toxin-antitoxin system, parDE n=1 Tax=Candidatus Kentrum sp. FW TaxID=2126338 RepID=A0A450U3F7_9GAMM|nr:MAG: hypothetical protein BECKFW1821C_GA0114237_11346 [Candidatus Kentron sp. FW]